MYDIYYAHHRWKYGTQEEKYELELIRKYFPLARVFNPSTDLKSTAIDGEEVVMKECLETVDDSDILVFSSLDGCIGTGVYREVQEAKYKRKIIFYIYQDKLHFDFTVSKREEPEMTDRLYAFVDLNSH